MKKMVMVSTHYTSLWLSTRYIECERYINHLFPYPKHLIQPILKDFEHQENVKVTVIEDSTQVLLSKFIRRRNMDAEIFL